MERSDLVMTWKSPHWSPALRDSEGAIQATNGGTVPSKYNSNNHNNDLLARFSERCGSGAYILGIRNSSPICVRPFQQERIHPRSVKLANSARWATEPGGEPTTVHYFSDIISNWSLSTYPYNYRKVVLVLHQRSNILLLFAILQKAMPGQNVEINWPWVPSPNLTQSWHVRLRDCYREGAHISVHLKKANRY